MQLIFATDDTTELDFAYLHTVDAETGVPMEYPNLILDSYSRPCALEIVDSAQADLASDEGTAQAHPIDPFTIAGPA